MSQGSSIPPQTAPGARHRSRAFGLLWASDRPLEQFAPSSDAGPPDVIVTNVSQLADRPAGRPVNNGAVFADGARFRFGEALFDIYGGERVVWAAPGADAVPDGFYGTVAAIILAWRGLAPLHGSAVELGGKAVLVAGPSGAGKSALCEALVRRGGRLVSDDLTVMAPLTGAGVPVLLPGRPSIRLIADGAPPTGRKRLQSVPMVDLARAVPLGSLVLLGQPPVGQGVAGASEALIGQLFRPQWMKALPLRQARATTLFHASRNITIRSLPGAADRPDISVDHKAEQLISGLLGWREQAHGLGT